MDADHAHLGVPSALWNEKYQHLPAEKVFPAMVRDPAPIPSLAKLAASIGRRPGIRRLGLDISAAGLDGVLLARLHPAGLNSGQRSFPWRPDITTTLGCGMCDPNDADQLTPRLKVRRPYGGFALTAFSWLSYW